MLTQVSPIDPRFHPGWFGSAFSQLDANRRGRWRRGEQLNRTNKTGDPQRHATGDLLLDGRGGAPQERP